MTDTFDEATKDQEDQTKPTHAQFVYHHDKLTGESFIMIPKGMFVVVGNTERSIIMKLI